MTSFDTAAALAEFHAAVSHPDTDLLWLRRTLHDEEHEELVEALEAEDREMIARARLHSSGHDGRSSMTPSLVVLVPVLARPQNVAPLIDSFNKSMVGENVEASMLFLANPGDMLEIRELERQGAWHEVVPWRNGPKDYTRKMNWGVKMTTSDFILLGADDITFHPGWVRAALNVHVATGKLVIGTNDMANPLVKAGKHATHPLVHRDYVKFGTIDNPDELLHSGYSHNSVDVEFCETAMSRDQWAFAKDALVEHNHPTFKREIKRDMTYLKGLQYSQIDKQLVNRRRRLWDPEGYARTYARQVVPSRPTTPKARRVQR